ncbi:hypothetical protein D3C72_1726480 [compost metagenome]
MGVVQGIDRHLHRMGPLDRLALGEQPQRRPPPLADGDEVGARRNAVLTAFDFDYRRLQHPLGPYGRRQRLDGLLRVLHLPGVPGRGLQPVQRDHYLRAVTRFRKRGIAQVRGGGVSRRHGERLDGMSSHVCLLWARVAGTRKARLKPCPSARPG